MKIHDFFKLKDGGYALAGEFYRKEVNAAGIAANLLISGAMGSMAKATVDDLFLLRLDNNYTPTLFEKIEKDKEKFSMPELISTGLTARYLSSIGGFGYMYTDEGINGDQHTIIARGSFGDEKFGTVAITINSKNGISTKRFDLPKQKKVSYYVFRGKPGFVMISKYNAKEKTITLNLEKTN